ncbi:MAG: DUF4258 domain-containing protein [Proteobacteria bacterium]|nr:DUF4258 domain-containing protein [Pseudomonadota bacterium]
MRIAWGGQIESNGRRHSENRSIERNISERDIVKIISDYNEIESQSINCNRYYRRLENRNICVVAVLLGVDEYEIITVFEVT